MIARHQRDDGCCSGHDDQRVDLEYTFENAIAVDTVAFAVIGFEANVADFVSPSGDSASRRKAPSHRGWQRRLGVLAAGPVFVRLDDADFGLIAGNGNVAFELTEGSFAAGIDGLAGISAEEVTIQYTNATTMVDAATEIGVADLTYTFDNAIAANTVASLLAASQRTSRTLSLCPAISASRRSAPTSSPSATTFPPPPRPVRCSSA